MLAAIHPKLPMRSIEETKQYYTQQLSFSVLADYDNYLIVQKDNIEIHFFEFKALQPSENYGQVYIRTNDIDALYASFLQRQVPIHPNGQLETKPWGQREFSLLDPDFNLLTFGQAAGNNSL